MNFLSPVHPEWRPIIERSLQCVRPEYLKQLSDSNNWLPGPQNILNAFSLPLSQTRYILFGESPYPRPISANGYAFWDASVNEIWSDTGLSKPVNRATSLRNMMKMLLIAEELLTIDTVDQANIAALNKDHLIQSLPEFFEQLLKKGFLLLNASLVLSDARVSADAKAWSPFMENLLVECHQHNPDMTLILFGKVALQINQFTVAKQFKQMTAMHPYNLSFISDPTVIDFFKNHHLLLKSR